MLTRLRKSNNLMGTYTLEYLRSRNYGIITPVRIGNDYVAILSKRQLNNIATVSVLEETKIPLYNQHMDLMMGKRPNSVRQDLMQYRTMEIPLEFENNFRYYVYETY